jgi:hypothetical protein
LRVIAYKGGKIMGKSIGIKTNKSLTAVAALLIFGAFFLMTGCTHALRITNINDVYSPPAAPKKEPLRVGITSQNEMHPQNRRYVIAVVDALQRNGSCAQVIYPYSAATNRDMVDAVVDITVNPKYNGRGSNFFVNFPGFLIFAPANWGYGYEANIQTLISITDVKNTESVRITVPTRYEFRHADTGRTWTEVGWLEWGVIPLIGGVVFTGYDTGVTDEFITKVSPYYGPYVANKIIAALPEKNVTYGRPLTDQER